MNQKLAIIDIDGLFYQSSKETLQESLNTFDERLNNIFEQTKATHYIAFCSFSPYFRNDIDKDYKQHRKKYKTPLKWIKTLKSYAIEKYDIQWMKNVEADDLCAYWMNQKFMHYTTDMETHIQKAICRESTYLKNLELVKIRPELKNSSKWENVETILCSPDKDLLQSIPGKHFNYTYKLKEDIKVIIKEDTLYEVKDEDIIKGFWVETSQDETETFRKMQLVVGDSSDGIKGIEGKGIKYWEKMVQREEDLYTKILGEYMMKYGLSQGIYNFQKTYRLTHLLESDEDFIRELNTTPILPVINELDNFVESLNNHKELPNFD